jgi:membrane-bound lytic murein transglycosylase A
MIGIVMRYAYVQGAMYGVAASFVGAILCFVASGASAEEPLNLAGTQLEPVTWAALADWTGDDHLAAFAAFQRSCQALLKRRRNDDHGPIYGALWSVCQKAIGIRPPDPTTARIFFEQNFQPVRIARLGEAEGLLTGYFEPIVQGSRFPTRVFHFPLYRRPPDLVAAGHKPGSVAFPNKGRIGRLNEKNQLVPYYDRNAIEAGALDGQRLEICWLRDPLDVVAIQLEGSGRVILEDGTPLRVNYDSHNGYPYSSITRVLIERHLIPREDMSTQRIRDWMAANPEEAAKVRATNRSYVFFRITGLSNADEPVGGQGVPLTAGRSIAVDRQHEYGTPFFIEADLPIDSAKPLSPFRRVMIAQDTGSAIVGPARADVYWGAGDDAGRIASRIRHPGRFVMLLPRELDMIEAGRHMPLPLPRPRTLQVAVNNHSKRNVVTINYDEHRPAATSSVRPAVPARLQPAHARCSSCVPQPNQVREAVGECCGPKNSGRILPTQKSDNREFAARLRIGTHHRPPEPGNKRAPSRILSPLQAAKPITRSNNL